MKRRNLISKTAICLYLVLATFLFASCGGSTDKQKCYNSVKEMFPNAEVFAPHEGSNTKFIVVDSVNIYFVETMSLASPKVTDVTLYVRGK